MSDYKLIAAEVRKRVLTMVHQAQTSHIGSNFSITDIGVYIYENLKPEDRVVWSKGWCAALIYTLLAYKGIIPVKDLEKFPQHPYIGLAEPAVPGVEVAGGSMAHGLNTACGMALGKRDAAEDGRVFCILSDGELQEGSTWEAAWFAAKHKLWNLTAIVDCNKFCAMGRTEEVADMEPIDDKFRAFGWYVQRINGHDFLEIEKAIGMVAADRKRPTMIIADTVKGNGVSFMEGTLLYHYKYISDDEFKRAMKEL